MGIVPAGQRARLLAASRGHRALPLREPADRSGCGGRAQSAELVCAAQARARALRRGARRHYANRLNWRKAPATWPSIPCPWIRCRSLARAPQSADRRDAVGTQIQYLGFNLRDPLLKDARIRQAIACAIDRGLHHPHLAARPRAARGESAARQPLGLRRGDVARYDYDPVRARAAAGRERAIGAAAMEFVSISP